MKILKELQDLGKCDRRQTHGVTEHAGAGAYKNLQNSKLKIAMLLSIIKIRRFNFCKNSQFHRNNQIIF